MTSISTLLIEKSINLAVTKLLEFQNLNDYIQSIKSIVDAKTSAI
jgi:hypothetical protein